MKSYFFVLFFIFLVLPSVSAVGFSPSSLTYDLQQGEEKCQVISLTDVTEQIEVTNLWAESPEVEWELANFDTLASEHDLNLFYTIDNAENGKEVNVCISGSDLGEYHGVIIFRQEQEGNSIVQLAVWLKVIITEVIQPPASSASSSGGGGGSGGKKAGITTVSIQESEKETANEIAEFEELSAETETDEEENAGITGNAINNDERNISVVNFIPIIFIAVIIAVSIYIKRKRKELSYE